MSFPGSNRSIHFTFVFGSGDILHWFDWYYRAITSDSAASHACASSRRRKFKDIKDPRRQRIVYGCHVDGDRT